MFNKLRHILLLCIVWIFTFKFFQSTAIEPIFFQVQAAFLGFVLIYLGFYVLSFFAKGKGPENKAIWFYLGLLLFVPVYAGMRADQEFGQPFIYGFLSEREWIILGVGIWLYGMLVKNKLSLTTIEMSFVFMAWASLVFFSIYILTFDPSKFYNPLSDVFIKVNDTEVRGLRFKFQNYFIVFGAIYYFVKYSLQRKWFDVISFSAFIAYVVLAIQGRSLMLALGAVLFVFYLRHLSSRKTLYGLFVTAVLMVFLSLALKFLYPYYFEKMYFLFQQLFTVFTGEESLDSSANSRIYQSLIVSNYFDSNPVSFWFGTGSVSWHWNDGYQSILGYFYPSDIGMWGGVFVYGILGCFLICFIPVLFTISAMISVSRDQRAYEPDKKNIFIVTLSYLLFYSIIGIPQGSYFFGLANYSVPLFVLMAYLKLRRGISYDE